MPALNPMNLGPLRFLLGTWEGNKGDDKAPSDDRKTETNLYKERMVLEPQIVVDNHEQKLFGLKYTTTAWRLSEPDPFHEECGYFLWDPGEQQVMKCFTVPRGIAVLAGGYAGTSDKTFTMTATRGSPTYGVVDNQFLDREFKTVLYKVTFQIIDENTMSYEQDTQILMKGRPEIFHHTDKNTLKRV